MKYLPRLVPAVLPAGARIGATAEPGFVDIFNGQDFTGRTLLD
jgi:hypothetical protein